MKSGKKKINKRLQKATVRAFNAVLKSLELEPKVVIVEGSQDSDNSYAVKEITSWLFRRRDENGS